MSRAERIFNNRPRKVFRKFIPKHEAMFGAGFLVFVGLMTWWFLAQRDAYDPAERDISMELMEAGSVEDTLYRTPLQHWVDPARAGLGGGTPLLDLGVFPPAILEGDWRPASRVQNFNVDNVYEKINGAAEQYIQFGFQYLHFVALKAPESDLEVNIELYDMGEFQNALGIFAEQRSSNAPIQTVAASRFYDTETGALGIAGPYYFKIAGTEAVSAAVEKARQLAGVFGRMERAAAAVPEPFRVFSERMKIPFDGIQYYANDVFQYGFARDFWFAQDLNHPEMRYYVHRAADAAAARALFDELVKNFLFDYSAVEQGGDGVLLKHQFLDEYLAVRLRGDAVYGVDAAPEPGVLAQALATMEAAFFRAEEAATP